jgi:peroxiredoxin
MRSKEAAIVGVSMDDDHNAIPGFVRASHIAYPILVPLPSASLPGSVESLPTTLLIDRDGRVARSYIGAVSETVFATDIERLLRETAPNLDPKG